MVSRDRDFGGSNPYNSGEDFTPEQMEKLQALRAKLEAKKLKELSRQMRSDCVTFLIAHGRRPNRWSDVVQAYKDALLQEVETQGEPIPDCSHSMSVVTPQDTEFILEYNLRHLMEVVAPTAYPGGERSQDPAALVKRALERAQLNRIPYLVSLEPPR